MFYESVALQLQITYCSIDDNRCPFLQFIACVQKLTLKLGVRIKLYDGWMVPSCRFSKPNWQMLPEIYKCMYYTSLDSESMPRCAMILSSFLSIASSLSESERSVELDFLLSILDSLEYILAIVVPVAVLLSTFCGGW